MPIETATYIGELDATLPTNGDPETQGAAHLRLIKSALQASFPALTRPQRPLAILNKTANYTVGASDENAMILVDTSAGAITIAFPLPSTSPFYIDVVKNTIDVNPVFVAPPFGTINGFGKIRLNVPFARQTFVYTGAVWLRVEDGWGVRPGSLEDCPTGTTVPVGYAYAAGQSLAVANHLELFAAWGYTYGGSGANFNAPDRRGYVPVGRDNMGGAAALRIDAFTPNVNTPGAVGGESYHVLGTSELPAHTHSGTTGNDSPGHDHDYVKSTRTAVINVQAGASFGVQNFMMDPVTTDPTAGANNAHQHGFTTDSVGSGIGHNNMQLSMITNFIFRLC